PIATSLLMMPIVVGKDLFSKMSTGAYSAIFLAVVIAVALFLAYFLHRPNELADLAASLGLTIAPQSREALTRALPATVLFFVALVLASLTGAGARYAR